MFGKLKSAASSVATAVKEKSEDVKEKRVAALDAAFTKKVDKNGGDCSGGAVHSSLEGQDLTFETAWRVLGVANAAKIFDEIGNTFDRCRTEPHKSQLTTALLYISGNGDPKESSDSNTPDRMVRMTRTEEDTLIQSVDIEDAEKVDTSACNCTHLVQLTCSPSRSFASTSGHIESFFSLEAIAAFMPRMLETLDVSNQAVVDLIRREFHDLSQTFFFLGDAPISVLDDSASDFSLTPGIARLVNFKLPVSLKKMAEFGKVWSERILTWANTISFEVLDKHTIGKPHSKRRAFSMKWDRSNSEFAIDFVKAGESLLWHDKENMKNSTIMYNKLIPSTIPANKVNFAAGTTFVLRYTVSLCILDAKIISIGSTTTSTTLYFTATIREDKTLELNLIDITGLSGRFAKLAFSNTLASVAESVKIFFGFTESSQKNMETEDTTQLPEAQHIFAAVTSAAASKDDTSARFTTDHVDRDGRVLENPFNRFSWNISGTGTGSSILVTLLKLMWDKIVLSEFIWEFFDIWKLLWKGLAHDIRRHNALSKGPDNSLQRKIVVAQRTKQSLEDIRSIFIHCVEAVLAQHAMNLLHGDIRPETVIFDISTHKWRIQSLQNRSGWVLGNAFQPAEVTNCSPPEAVIAHIETMEDGKQIQSMRKASSIEANTSYDVWSLGALLFQLTNGTLTSLHEEKYSSIGVDGVAVEGKGLSLARKLLEWSDEVRNDKLTEMIPDRIARNLISQMLQQHPSRRIPLARVLLHPFVTLSQGTRLPGEQAEFDVFLSYRVASDSDHVKDLYTLLSNLGLKVWWDVKCLKSGQPWEEGFCEGLANSSTFVCLLSRGAINHTELKRQNFSYLNEESSCDNVALEWRLALELKERGMLTGIFPIFIGDKSDDGVYSDYFKSGCHPDNIPNIAVRSVDKKLNEHLNRQGLGTPYEMASSLSSITAKIQSFQGGFLRGPYEPTLKEIADQIVNMTKASSSRPK